jgi:O-antigen ligase
MRPTFFPLSNTAVTQQVLRRVTDGALVAFALFAVVSLSLTQAAYILAVAAWMLRLYLQNNDRHVRLPLLVPVCSFALASLLATLTAIAPYQSLVEIRNVLEVTLFYLVLNTVTEERAVTLTHILIIAGTVMALYGLSQSVVMGTAFRIHGMLGAYMTFANLLMLLGIMTLAYLFCSRGTRQLLWLIPTFGVLTAALLMTHTRGSWLGCIAGIAVVVGLCQKRLLLLFPPLLLVVFLLIPQAVQERIYSIVDPQNATVQTRLCKWRLAWNMIQAHPWTGVGMNNIQPLYLAYKDPQDPVACGDRRLGHLDNNLMQIAVERGLLGLACWLSIWIAYLRHVCSTYRGLSAQSSQAKALVISSLASVVGFHVAGCFEYTYGDAEIITPVYFLMALPFLVSARQTPPPAAHRAAAA